MGSNEKMLESEVIMSATNGSSRTKKATKQAEKATSASSTKAAKSTKTTKPTKTTASAKSAKAAKAANAARSAKAASSAKDSKTLSNAGKQKLKLIYLLKILENKTDATQGLTMPQLIECLREEGISAERKSLYNDIEILRDAGYDITVLSTRPCQYAHVRSELGFDEVMMLIDTVQSSRFLSENKSNQLVRSLKSLVSAQERRKLDMRVHVFNRIKNQSESVFHSVNKIHEALHDKKKIEFLYFGYDTHLERKARHYGRRYSITPVKVVFADSNYYLAGYDSDDKKVKIYRIDRMELLQVSMEDAAVALEITNYKLEEFDYQIFGMFQGKPAKVVLRVDAKLMDAVVDKFGDRIVLRHASKKMAEIGVKVQVSPQFFGWIAGLDGKVAIKAPNKIAMQYREWLQGLANNE